MKSKVYYYYGNPIKSVFRKHLCIACGHKLEMKKHRVLINSKSEEAKSGRYDFTTSDSSIIGDCEFIHKIYCCLQCGKEIEPITQISYEDNEKWGNTAYNKLLKHFKPEQINKLWVDKNNNTLDSSTNIENLQSILFLITIGEKEYNLPCSIVGRKKYWEQPYYFKKSKGFNKTLSNLIKETSVEINKQIQKTE